MDGGEGGVTCRQVTQKEDGGAHVTSAGHQGELFAKVSLCRLHHLAAGFQVSSRCHLIGWIGSFRAPFTPLSPSPAPSPSPSLLHLGGGQD